MQTLVELEKSDLLFLVKIQDFVQNTVKISFGGCINILLKTANRSQTLT